MSIEFQCPCGRRHSVRQDQGAQPFRCSACGRLQRVPQAPAAPVGQARSQRRIAGLLVKTWLNVVLAVEAILIVLLVSEIVQYLPHERTGVPGGELPVVMPEGQPEGGAGQLAGKWARPAAQGLEPSSLPASHVPTVTRGNEGVIIRKNRKTGTPELIVDPFPEEGPVRNGKPGAKRYRTEGIDTEAGRQ